MLFIEKTDTNLQQKSETQSAVMIFNRVKTILLLFALRKKSLTLPAKIKKC